MEPESWKQDQKKSARVKQFMNILEQLPRLCSPTICGTLSQPTTKTERVSRGTDKFEWSLEQKAILSPANITTDTDATDDWQNVAEMNQSWLQKESEVFFSQKTIAPSPMVTPSTRAIRSRPGAGGRAVGLGNNNKEDMFDENDEDDEFSEGDDHDADDDASDTGDDDDHHHGGHHNYQYRRPVPNIDDEDTDIDMDDEASFDIRRDLMSDCEDDNEDDHDDDNGRARYEHDDDQESDREVGDNITDDEDTDINDCDHQEEDQDMDSLFFSPQPIRSSQTQQRMDIFSPDTFHRVMEDDFTIQSTPKTIGSQLTRTRTRTRTEMSD